MTRGISRHRARWRAYQGRIDPRRLVFIGDVVILDNLGSHKGKAVRQAIRAVGARLMYLPKYSPDLNPIEQVFAKFKTLLRKAKPEHTMLSPMQAQPSSLNTRPTNPPPM